MSRGAKIAVNVLVTVLIIAYGVWSIMLTNKNEESVTLRSVDVTFVDSAEVQFITPREITRLITRELYPIGTKIEEVELYKIDSALKANQYLQNVEVWTTIEGAVKVVAQQRKPLFRVVDQGGADFYVDSTLTHLMLPAGGYVEGVPILSTKINFTIPTDYGGELSKKNNEKDIDFIKKLATFVGYMRPGGILQELSGQFFVEEIGGELEVDIIPERGNSIIQLGTIAPEMADRIENVEKFYTQAYNYARLDSAQVVDARFRGQILVR